ncbi:hypothetical protein OROGR_022927 [Orobanche gracilis]
MSSCTVAISNSPAFSPSSSSSSVCSPKSSSPRLVRLHNPTSGLINAFAGGSESSTAVLKRKRPPRLDIPVVLVEAKAEKVAESREEAEVVEVEGDGYTVCCKRGKREAMEDRYSAVLGFQGDSKQDTRRRRRRGESIIITLITINNFKFNSFVGIDETIKGVGRHTNNGITGKQVIIFKPRRPLWKDGIFFLSYPFIVRINFINDNGINFISPLNASLP